jgi:hypothetical protein
MNGGRSEVNISKTVIIGITGAIRLPNRERTKGRVLTRGVSLAKNIEAKKMLPGNIAKRAARLSTTLCLLPA